MTAFRSETASDRWYAAFLVAACVVLRLLPHPANFAPVAAFAIFSGATLPRRWAIAVPVLTMAITDAFMGFHRLVPVTWGLFALTALLGEAAARRPSWLRFIGASAAGSFGFFVVTNLAVFLFSGLYPQTREGLFECFVLALPFFRQTLAADIFFTLVLFTAFSLSRAVRRKPAGSRAV